MLIFAFQMSQKLSNYVNIQGVPKYSISPFFSWSAAQEMTMSVHLVTTCDNFWQFVTVWDFDTLTKTSQAFKASKGAAFTIFVIFSSRIRQISQFIAPSIHPPIPSASSTCLPTNICYHTANGGAWYLQGAGNAPTMTMSTLGRAWARAPVGGFVSPNLQPRPLYVQ